MDQSVLSYCVIYRLDQSILNSIFLKHVAMGKTIVATGITTIVMDIDNSYVATDADDIIIPVATVFL
jgi:hypothetical protein